jgi:hypothetical protein
MNLFSQEFSEIGARSNLGGLAAAASDKEISDYVFKVLNTTGLTDQERALQIADAARQYGVDVQDISRATGYSIAQVTDYLSLANQIATDEQYYQPIVSTTANVVDYKTTSGVSSSEVKDVIDYYLNDFRLSDQDRAALIQNYIVDANISINEVSQITGFSTNDVANYLAIANTDLFKEAEITAARLKAEEDARIRAAAEKARQDAAAAAAIVRAAQDAADAAARAKAAQDAAIAAGNARAAQEAALAAAKAKAAQDAAIKAASDKAKSDALKASESNKQAKAAQEAADLAKLNAAQNSLDKIAAAKAKAAQDAANLAKLKAAEDAAKAKVTQDAAIKTNDTKSPIDNVIQTNQSSNTGILILAAIAAYLIGS